jgi:hypothetical protein
MRYLMRALLVVARLGGSVPVAAAQAQRPEPLPAEIVAAWEKGA